MEFTRKHSVTWAAKSRSSALSRCARRLFEAAVMVTIFSLLSSIPDPAFAAQSWPELPMPPKAKVQIVAASMRVNGVPTRVFQFESEASRTEVVEYYRSHWTGGYEHPASVHPLGQATVVGQKHGPYLLTLKVEEGEKGKSHGLLSMAQVVGSRLDRSPGVVPLLPGAQVVSVVESDDPGKHSRQVVIFSTQPTASVSRFYEKAFANAGWIQVQAPSNARAARSSPTSFVAFARGPSEMQVSVAQLEKGQGTVVLANLVTKDTGRRLR